MILSIPIKAGTIFYQ